MASQRGSLFLQLDIIAFVGIDRVRRVNAPLHLKAMGERGGELVMT